MGNANQIPTQPYKGMRDFYPKDWAVQRYIFKTWRKVCQSFGFQEYMTPTIESFDLYAAKTGQEVVNEQLFDFVDRGKRRVALRPEITPSVARLIAAREKQLPKPIKWFSIANFFRYEQPQKGRMREFWQLNADIFGVDSVTADFEILQLNRAMMDAFGAKPKMYEVRVNNRKLVETSLREILNSKSEIRNIVKILDRKEKVSEEKFKDELEELGLSVKQTSEVNRFLNLGLHNLRDLRDQSPAAAELVQLFDLLEAVGIAENIVFDPATVRGLDYYDRIVFEQFDATPRMRRSMFGGGRYNGLLKIFGREEFPATGFAPGDVTTQLFLENWDLLPENLTRTQPQVLMTVFPDNFEKFFVESSRVARKLRKEGIAAELILEEQSLSDQLDYANRREIPYVIILGPEEIEVKQVTLKGMRSGGQKQLKIDSVVTEVLNHES